MWADLIAEKGFLQYSELPGIVIGRLHLELEYSREAVPFNSTYSPEP